MYFGFKKREKWISKIRNEMKKIEKKIERLGLGLTRRRHCSRRARVGPVQELTDLKKFINFFTKYSWIWKFSKKSSLRKFAKRFSRFWEPWLPSHFFRLWDILEGREPCFFFFSFYILSCSFFVFFDFSFILFIVSISHKLKNLGIQFFSYSSGIPNLLLFFLNVHVQNFVLL